MFDKSFWFPILIITLTILFTLALAMGTLSALNLVPPGAGIVVEVGHHPAFFPEAFCNEERYYVVIENLNRTQCWTWYIDEWYWKRFEVGDTVGVYTW